MEYMLVPTEKYNYFQSRNPGIWALPILGLRKTSGIPGLQSLAAINETENWVTKSSRGLKCYSKVSWMILNDNSCPKIVTIWPYQFSLP